MINHTENAEVLDLVYKRVIKILEEVDEYMTNPEQRYSTDEYNMMFGRMEACNEVMKVLKNNEDYEYTDTQSINMIRRKSDEKM